MADIKVAFWNLQNLFDSTASKIAADLEFTPDSGWTEEAVEKKIDRLVEGIATMFPSSDPAKPGGPDLLGVCEIENEGLLRRLMEGMKDAFGREDYTIAHHDAPDIRGIDCALIYSDDVFELAANPEGYLVHFRYPTRDIFEVPLRVKDTGVELIVYVTHWPSRRGARRDSEPFRIAVASHLGRLIDAQLKLPREDLMLADRLASIADRLDAEWNRNILVMGDLNDDPFNASVMEELLATNSLDRIEEPLKIPEDDRDIEEPGKRKRSDIAKYLGVQAHLFNLSWEPVGRSGEGTIFWSKGDGGRTLQMFDQMIVSRSLALGLSGLRASSADFAIHRPKLLRTSQAGDLEKAPHKIRPKKFDRKSGKGYSDHFPVTALIRETDDDVA